MACFPPAFSFCTDIVAANLPRCKLSAATTPDGNTPMTEQDHPPKDPTSLDLPAGEREDRQPMRYRKALGIAAALNLVGGALYANSIALMADAIDFLEDSITYVLAIALIGLGHRARAVFGALTAFLMFVPGVWIGWKTIDQLYYGLPPDPLPMGAVGLLALAVNLYCAFLLLPHRKGDSAHQGVWLSTRNDAIANIAIVLAAVVTAFTGTVWPDVVVGLGIAVLNLYAALLIALLAVKEWHGKAPSGV
jgi:Co/Zn/Cd efflux system component